MKKNTSNSLRVLRVFVVNREKKMAEKPENVPSPADFFGWMNQMMTMPMKAMADMLPHGANVADPIDFWRNMNQRNEEIFGKFLQQLVGTPDFAASLGQTANASAWYRNAIKQTARFYLEAADMPTREDVARLGEMMINIEGKLEELNDSVVNLEDELDETEDSMEALSGALKDMVKTKDLQEAFKAQSAPKVDFEPVLTALKDSQKESKQLDKVVTMLESLTDRLGKIESRLDKLETAKPNPTTPKPKTATPKSTAPKTPQPGVKKTAEKTETA